MRRSCSAPPHAFAGAAHQRSRDGWGLEVVFPNRPWEGGGAAERAIGRVPPPTRVPRRAQRRHGWLRKASDATHNAAPAGLPPAHSPLFLTTITDRHHSAERYACTAKRPCVLHSSGAVHRVQWCLQFHLLSCLSRYTLLAQDGPNATVMGQLLQARARRLPVHAAS